MKLNASKTSTMLVSRSRTVHPLSPAWTIGGTVLKESEWHILYPVIYLVILWATFDSMIRPCIFNKSWQAFHDRVLLLRCFGILSCLFWSTVSNQKCMYGAAQAISGNRWLYLVIFGMPLEPYYFELVLVGFRWLVWQYLTLEPSNIKNHDHWWYVKY